jgi:hypothetical protein
LEKIKMARELKEYQLNLKNWPGYVLTPGYFSFPELVKWEKAVRAIEGQETKDLELMYTSIVPFICDFVTEWHVDRLPAGKLTPEEFPGDASFLSRTIEIVNAVFVSTNELPDADLPKES